MTLNETQKLIYLKILIIVDLKNQIHAIYLRLPKLCSEKTLPVIFTVIKKD